MAEGKLGGFTKFFLYLAVLGLVNLLSYVFDWGFWLY